MEEAGAPSTVNCDKGSVPAHRGYSWSHHPRSRATQDAKRKAALEEGILEKSAAKGIIRAGTPRRIPRSGRTPYARDATVARLRGFTSRVAPILRAVETWEYTLPASMFVTVLLETPETSVSSRWDISLFFRRLRTRALFITTYPVRSLLSSS